MSLENVFHDLPDLQTPRLLLRKMTVEDTDAIFAYASDPEVSRLTTWESPRTRADSEAYVASTLDLYQVGQVAPWGLILKESGQYVGTAGFVYWETEHARAEFGYSLSRAFWGKGLATEAARAIISFGFEVLALNRIEAKCMVENVASERVMQKAGLRFDAVLRQYWQKHGQFHDVRVYSLLRSDPTFASG